MQTRSQLYAQSAFTRVDLIRAAKAGQPELAQKYGAIALNFPVLILQSGLAQACGFVLAKQRQEHLRYLDDLAAVLGEKNGGALHARVIASSLPDYMHLTRCTLDAAGWFKRYAQGVLGVESAEGEAP